MNDDIYMGVLYPYLNLAQFKIYVFNKMDVRISIKLLKTFEDDHVRLRNFEKRS